MMNRKMNDLSWAIIPRVVKVNDTMAIPDCSSVFILQKKAIYQIFTIYINLEYRETKLKP